MKLSGHFRLLFSLTQPTSDTMIGFKVSRILLATNQNMLRLVLEFLEAFLQPTKMQEAYFIRPSSVSTIFKHEKATILFADIFRAHFEIDSFNVFHCFSSSYYKKFFSFREFFFSWQVCRSFFYFKGLHEYTKLGRILGCDKIQKMVVFLVIMRNLPRGLIFLFYAWVGECIRSTFPYFTVAS